MNKCSQDSLIFKIMLRVSVLLVGRLLFRPGNFKKKTHQVGFRQGSDTGMVLAGARSLASLTSRSHSHLDIFYCSIIFRMQEFSNLLFLFYEKVFLPGLQTLDWKRYFLSTRPTGQRC